MYVGGVKKDLLDSVKASLVSKSMSIANQYAHLLHLRSISLWRSAMRICHCQLVSVKPDLEVLAGAARILCRSQMFHC